MIAQTFYVPNPTFDTSGVYLHNVILYFSRLPTSPSVAISIDIREVENGIPTERIIPFSKVTVLNSDLQSIYNTQTKLDSSTTGTDFNFGIPVFLQTQREYALVISAEGDHPDFDVWVSAINEKDVASGLQISKNPSMGVLQTSTNGRTWTAIQDSDLKFCISYAKFSTLSGNVVFTNANTEYLQRNVIMNPKPFLRGERIYVSNGIIGSSNVKTTVGSTTIKVIPANTQYANAVNKLIYLSTNSYSQTDIRSIISVTTVGSNTELVLNSSPTFTDGNATIGFLYSNGALYGDECYVNGPSDLILYRSTANSTMNFRELMISKNTQPLLIGATSKTAANIVSTGVAIYDEIIPQFAHTEPPKTNLRVYVRGTSLVSNTLDSNYVGVMFDRNTKFIDKTRIVRSRSDELYFDAGQKSLNIKVDFVSESQYLTPTLNDIKRTALLVHNRLSGANSSIISEESNPSGGRMGNKYISKPVLLTQEAEDLVVYLTAYRPANTEIYVFCKLLNQEDSESIDNKYWTPMEEVAPKPYSSKVELSDMKELQYILPSNNELTITKTGYLNSNNSSIVRYYNNDGSYFDGYNTYSIKIILSASQTNIVPRVGDMRAIAVQI